VLTLAAPGNNGPLRIDPTLVQPPVTQLTTRAAALPNGMHATLAAAATNLLPSPPATEEEIPESSTPARPAYTTVATAAATATARTNLFLGVADRTPGTEYS
jgi:hypothetical protein